MATTRTSTAAVIAAILLVGGCGGSGGHSESRVPNAAEIGGTYDLTTTKRGSTTPARSGVGVVNVGDGLHVALSDPPAELAGVLQPDGSVRLAGRPTATDVIVPLEGTARVRLIDDAYWVTGTIQTLDVNFAMTRPVGSDLRPASGHYRFSFPQSFGSSAAPSTIDVIAEIGATGTGTLPHGHEIDERGNELAELSFGTLDVAPSGRFHFETTYAESDGGCGSGIERGPCLLRVDGHLPESSATSTARAELLGGLRMQVGAGEIQIERTP